MGKFLMLKNLLKFPMMAKYAKGRIVVVVANGSVHPSIVRNMDANTTVVVALNSIIWIILAKITICGVAIQVPHYHRYLPRNRTQGHLSIVMIKLRSLKNLLKFLMLKNLSKFPMLKNLSKFPMMAKYAKG